MGEAEKLPPMRSVQIVAAVSGSMHLMMPTSVAR